MGDGLIGAIIGGLVVLVPVVIKGVVDLRGSKSSENQQNHTQKISENEQAFTIYKNLVENLQKNVTQLSTDMLALEKEYILVREQNAELRVENRQLKEEIKKLSPPTTN